jgi:hypothetical protein
MSGKREPAVYDTISKGGNFWRITEINGEEIIAKRTDSGNNNKRGGRSLKITKSQIEDGTYRLCDIPPVTVVKEGTKSPEQLPITEPPTDLTDDDRLRLRYLKLLRETLHVLNQAVDAIAMIEENKVKERTHDQFTS